MQCIPMRPRNVQKFRKTTVMGLCDIHNRNSNKKNKKKQRIKCIRHTTPFLTNTHTHPKDRKEVKTDENSSPAYRLRYTGERPGQRRHSSSVEKNTHSNVHAYFPPPASTSYTSQHTLAGENTHHPASVTDINYTTY